MHFVKNAAKFHSVSLKEMLWISKNNFEYITQVEVPSGSDLWSDRARQSNFRSDHPRLKYPLIRLKSALGTVFDQTSPDGKDLWSDQNQTTVQTIERPWPRLNPDHRPDDCALKTTSDQPLCAQKSILIRLLCARNHLWSDSIALEIVQSVNVFHYERILL